MKKKLLFLAMLLAFAAQGLSAENLNDLMRRARNGEAEAQYRLGESYAYSQNGASYDKATAIVWFNKALDQGYKEALFDLGLMYRHDQSTRQRAIECFKGYLDYYYSKTGMVQETAANCLRELGVTDYTPGRSSSNSSYSGGSAASSAQAAGNWLSYSGPLKDFSSYPTPTENLTALRREAQGGNPVAQYRLGEYYSYGYKDTPVDNQEALRWFNKALEQGYEKAYFDLALIYRTLGDTPKAIYYFKLSCDYASLADESYEVEFRNLNELGVTNYRVGSTRGASRTAATQSSPSSSSVVRQQSQSAPQASSQSFMLAPGFYNFSKILFLDDSGAVADYLDLTGSVEVSASYIRICSDDGDVNCKFDISGLGSPAVSAAGVHSIIDKRGNEIKAWRDSDGRKLAFDNKGQHLAVEID